MTDNRNRELAGAVNPTSPMDKHEGLPLSTDDVLREAREAKRWHDENGKPYTAGVIADCIATIERLAGDAQTLPRPAMVIGPNTISGNENFPPSSGLDYSEARLLLWFKSWNDAVVYEAALASLVSSTEPCACLRPGGDPLGNCGECAPPPLPPSPELPAEMPDWMTRMPAKASGEPIALINARLEDLAEANAIYGKDQRLGAPDKIARNDREISWLKDLRSLILTASTLPSTHPAAPAEPQPTAVRWEVGKNGWDASDEATREDI